MAYNDKKRAYMKEYQRKHRARRRTPALIEARRLYNAEYGQRNFDIISRRLLEYVKKNPEVRRRANRKYYRKNKALKKANAAKYRAAKLQRMPKWLTLEQKQQIVDFYINCPKGMVVDHIIPLQGTRISGLHHPDNLQYLTRSENSKKHNGYDLL